MPTAERMATIERAPAKLTLSLRIVGVRGDGYHLIDAEMVTLSLADELTFGAATKTTLRTTMDLCGGWRGLAISDGPDNLVARALAQLGRHAEVAIRKRIPAGAGLGGGSADAAAVYRWAGRTAAEDVAGSAALGADVPFCIRGGRARVTGIGETIEPLATEAKTFTLLIPPFGISTPAVYRAWDTLRGPTGSESNDLESAALRVEPELARWRDRLGYATGRTPTLAGSGATWFVEGSFPGDGRVVVTTDLG